MFKAGLGFVRNEHAWSVESSLQSISSNSLLGKRTNCSVVIQMWTWRGKSAASARAWLRERRGRAVAFCYSVRICYMFLILKCTGWSDLGLCMTSGLAKRMRLRSADFLFFNVFGHKIIKFVRIRHCATGFLLQVPKSCTDLDLTLLYISIMGTYHKFVRKIKC